MDKVSVVVPCRNEQQHIVACLEHLVANQTDTMAIEVLVVDGMSDDDTRERIRQYAQEQPAVKMIDNPAQTTPFAFNLGIKAATGNYVCIVGARMLLDADYLSVCLRELKTQTGVECVGGKLTNEYENETSEVIAQAMASPFGVGGGNWRNRTSSGYSDTVTAPLYRRALFAEIGFFDEELARNQDDEFNFRLTKAGHKIWFTADTGLRYFVRASYGGLRRQYFQYGYWKVFVGKKHKAVTTVRQLAPALLVLAIALGAAIAWIHPWLFWLWLAGTGAYLCLALLLAIKSGGSRFIGVFGAFMLLHFGYGFGYWSGIIDFLVLGSQPRQKHQKLSR